MNLFVLSVLSLLFLINGGQEVKTAGSKPLVKFEEGRISVKAEAVPLKDLLEEIGEKSGIEIELKDAKAAEKSVSIDVENVRPRRALNEILDGLNFAYFYSRTSLARVLILAPGDTPPEGFRRPFGARRQRGRRLGRFRRENLEGKSLEEKMAAVRAMRSAKDTRSVEELGKALTDQDPEVKGEALEALIDKEEGENVTRMLRQGLNDPDPEFRMEVLEALADRGDLDSVRKASSDPDPEVREAAADLLESAAP